MDTHLGGPNQEATHLHRTHQVVPEAPDLDGHHMLDTWEAHLKEVDPSPLLPHNLEICMAGPDGISLQVHMALDPRIRVLEVHQQLQRQVQHQVQANLMEVSHPTQISTRYF